VESESFSYEWKAVRISWRGLDQELVSPAIECIETFGIIDVVHKHAAVGPSIECYP